MKILPQIIPVGLIIIPHQVKITHFHFIPSKYENHYHGMILESIIFILKRYGYYTSVFAVYPLKVFATSVYYDIHEWVLQLNTIIQLLLKLMIAR